MKRQPFRRRRRVEPTWDGPSEVVASGLGDDTGGGMYVLQAGTFETIDRISTTGLAATPNGRCLARLPWTDDDLETPGEVLLYDERGVLAYHRVDELHEPHSALWDGDQLVVVSTRTNTIVWLDGNGTVARRWKAPGEGDCWHVNSLTVHRGRLLVSAFGRFDEHRGWLEASVREGRGIVVDVASEREVLSGLTTPHNPTWLDGRWLVCSSGEGELLSLDAEGAVLDRVLLGGWTRGLAHDDDQIFVGVSAHRLSDAGKSSRTASVVALDRTSLEVVDRWALPCREVYDIALLPTPLVAGLRTGFRTNRQRVTEQSGIGLMEAMDGPRSGL